jgi:hypothetical protein
VLTILVFRIPGTPGNQWNRLECLRTAVSAKPR